jgi:hypothetical protein
MQIRNFSVAAVGWIFLLSSTVAGAWTVNDDYDNQSVGEGCGSFWGGGSSVNSKVTNENSSSGSKSCKMQIYEGGKGWGGGFSLPAHLNKGDEFWIRFRLFVPNGFNYNVSTTSSNKFIRLAVKDASNATSFLDWKWENEGDSRAYAVHIQRDNCSTDCWQYFGSSSERPVRGTWETYEMYVKFDTVQVDSGGQGRVRAWKNGKLIGDLTARRTMNNPDDYVGAIHIFSYWNGGSPQTQHLYFDDLVATNVKPDARDSQGNAYIGVGNFVAVAAPLPPSSIQ